jgi:hypothetical protein
MTCHRLKTESKYFNDVLYNRKSFEVRKNDRDYQVGDRLTLLEIRDNGDYTGVSLERKIIYVLLGGQFGIEKDYCVLGLSK